VLVIVLPGATPAEAEIIDGTNWADLVDNHTANIQNYNGVLMDNSTEWWVTGPPDADVNENGYAWDAGDEDTVAGWRTTNADESIVVYWETGLPDREGDDLWVHLYGGPAASSHVYASADGTTFHLIGTIGGGTPGYLRAETFDFSGLIDGCVHYVKVLRVASGPQTGTFFDAFGGGVIQGDLDGDCAADPADLPHFIDALLGEPPAHAGIDQSQGDMDGDGDVNGNDIQWFIEALIG
jgi:hypothetical protein